MTNNNSKILFKDYASVLDSWIKNIDDTVEKIFYSDDGVFQPNPRNRRRRRTDREEAVRVKADVKLQTLRKSISGLTKVVESIAEDVRSNLAISKEIQAQLGSLKASGSVSASDLKPETISSDGKEYLYYPGAPKNRKFYEKSEKGTPGKIVKRSIQKKLMPLVRNTRTAEKATPTPNINEITNSIISMVQTEQIKTVERILAEKAPEREKQVSEILQKISKQKSSNEVDNNEERDMLRNALQEALEQIIKDHPDLLKCSGGGGGGITGTLGDIAKTRGIVAAATAAGKMVGKAGRGIANSRLGQGIGRLFGRTPAALPGTGGIVPATPSAPVITPEPMGPPKPGAAPVSTPEVTATPKPTAAPTVAPTTQATPSAASKVAVAAEQTAPTAIKKPGVGSRLLGALGKAKNAVGKGMAKVAGKAAVKSVIKKIPIIGAIAGLGFAASRLMQGDTTGAALEAASGIAGTVPGIGTAASVGLDATLAAKDAGVFESKAPEAPNVTPTPQSSPTAVLSEQQKAAPTSGAALMELNRTINQVQVPEVTVPAPQINNITNNRLVPAPTPDRINIYNPENTFNRLQMQDIDHPSSYSNFNMG